MSEWSENVGDDEVGAPDPVGGSGDGEDVRIEGTLDLGGDAALELGVNLGSVDGAVSASDLELMGELLGIAGGDSAPEPLVDPTAPVPGSGAEGPWLGADEPPPQELLDQVSDTIQGPDAQMPDPVRDQAPLEGAGDATPPEGQGTDAPRTDASDNPTLPDEASGDTQAGPTSHASAPPDDPASQEEARAALQADQEDVKFAKEMNDIHHQMMMSIEP